MTRAALISMVLALVAGPALACSPGYVEAPGPLQRGDQCTVIKPLNIGESFAEAAMDLGNGRVAQVFGTGSGCDLYSSVLVTQCTSGKRLVIGPDQSKAEGNGGGVLIDIKASVAPDGALKLNAPLRRLASKAAGQGQDVDWIDHPSEAMGGPFADWSDVTCGCALFYPNSKGAS